MRQRESTSFRPLLVKDSIATVSASDGIFGADLILCMAFYSGRARGWGRREGERGDREAKEMEDEGAGKGWSGVTRNEEAVHTHTRVEWATHSVCV